MNKIETALIWVGKLSIIPVTLVLPFLVLFMWITYPDTQKGFKAHDYQVIWMGVGTFILQLLWMILLEICFG